MSRPTKVYRLLLLKVFFGTKIISGSSSSSKIGKHTNTICNGVVVIVVVIVVAVIGSLYAALSFGTSTE